jgi:hypothetical protein
MKSRIHMSMAGITWGSMKSRIHMSMAGVAEPTDTLEPPTVFTYSKYEV